MQKIDIRTLGELQLGGDGEVLSLPPSRRTRALLAYLLLSPGPHRREHLCELLWWMPDDPRGALRWSLSKLRKVLDGDDQQRLIADRERVEVDLNRVDIDIQRYERRLHSSSLLVGDLLRVVDALERPLLDGIDLHDQAGFQAWLIAQREQARQLQVKAFGMLAKHPELPQESLLPVARQWLKAEPYNAEAGTHLLNSLRRLGQLAEAQETEAALTQRFQQSGIDWTPPALTSPMQETVPQPTARELQLRQRIQFCKADDGTRIAYATVGEGPPMIKAANWLSHLELDWDAPIWSPLLRQLATRHQLVRYDERGNGLSDWDVQQLDFDAFVTDLETVVDATGIEQFVLLGISQGAAVSIEYAVRHPDRVSKLVLFGGYPAGWRVDASDEVIAEREAIMTLVASGWGQDNPAYRQIFSSTFMPSASADELEWFNEFQRATTSPDNAVRFLSAFGDIDVRSRLGQVQCPTLVLHSRGDQRIPVQTGLDLAATIPNAEFVGLDSDNHLLIGAESASEQFVNAIERFLATDAIET